MMPVEKVRTSMRVRFSRSGSVDFSRLSMGSLSLRWPDGRWPGLAGGTEPARQAQQVRITVYRTHNTHAAGQPGGCYERDRDRGQPGDARDAGQLHRGPADGFDG